jgi:microcystin-dependent protein
LASVTSFTAARLQEIEDTSVVAGSVNGMGNLILATKDGTQIDAGYIKGDTGDFGPERPLVAGVISFFGGTVPPAGWLICDGSAISRVQYAELFAAIGTTYGAGNGTTTFNLPNFKGRVAVGLDAAQTEFDTLGETGGAKTHTLTVAEMPSHTHTIEGLAGTDDLNFTGNGGAFAAADAVTPYDQQTQPTGGGQAHNNLQPYNVVHYIISIGNAGTSAAPAENYVGRGTTVERDTIFGVPATDPTRVALANRKIIWYNTDHGWEESYYSAAGKEGLVVPALTAPASSGWYPTGRGPMVLWEPPTQINSVQSTFMDGWSWIRRRGGAAWFDSADGRLIEIKRHGRYEVRVWTVQQSGSGTQNYHLRVVAADGSTIVRNVDGNAFPLHGSLYTRAHAEYDDVTLEATQKVGFYVNSGNAAVHVGAIVPRGQFLIRYIGPPLETD